MSKPVCVRRTIRQTRINPQCRITLLAADIAAFSQKIELFLHFLPMTLRVFCFTTAIKKCGKVFKTKIDLYSLEKHRENLKIFWYELLTLSKPLCNSLSQKITTVKKYV